MVIDEVRILNPGGTEYKVGQVIPAQITIYEDRSFTFITAICNFPSAPLRL